MVQLLVKDFRIQKRFIMLGFVFVGVVFFVLGAFEGMPLSVPAAIFSHFLIVVSSKMDERNNNGRMLVSFPLRRTDIVVSKYCGIVLFMALAFALTSLWRLLAGLVLPTDEMPWFDNRSVSITIAVLLVFYSIYFPLFFALGARLVQVLDVIVLFTVGGAVVLLLRIAEWSGINAGGVIRRVLAADDGNLSLWGIGGGFFLLLLSCLLSVFLYNRRSV
ncbi:ABC-2 transporter permease [Paenibacillus ginsengarvi]|nr:ABC-2 transporter permease [Paenibacillus ginsengarvi]